MANFYLKYRDTRPIIEVTLLDPDDDPYDLTGAGHVYLHIMLRDGSGTELEREMTVDADPTTGKATYQWGDADWDTGGLVRGTHSMEYEVVTASGNLRLTFPNDQHDRLIVSDDIGQGAE